MSRALTPCLPFKSCSICEARLFPKAAPPEKRAARYAHQAAQYGRFALDAIAERDADQAYAMARAAGRFVTLATKQLAAKAAA